MTDCINCSKQLADYADQCDSCGRDDCISDNFSNVADCKECGREIIGASQTDIGLCSGCEG